MIRWQGRQVRYKEASKDMLSQFVRLSDAESVPRFAKQWGVLALSGKNMLLPGGESITSGAEPVAAWLYYARRARSILNIAAALKQDRRGDLDDWSQLGMFVRPGHLTKQDEEVLKEATTQHKFGLGFSIIPVESRGVDMETARRAIAGEISQWLDCWKRKTSSGLSDLSLRWSEDQHRWDLQIDYHGLLFAAISLQLALVVANADSLYSCSGCGVPYIRSRQRKRPKRGWANYCDQCAVAGVAKRRAVQRYRDKRAQALRMHSSGVTLRRIAERLNTQTARINDWVKKDAG